MKVYQRVIELIDANLIYCLTPTILTLILVELLFKKRFETKKTLNLIRWIIIIYTITTWAFYLIGMITTENPNEYAFINRATGPYAVAYWVMLLAALVLPLTLFVKKLASKFWYIILVSFAMKSGIYLERFVIILTSFHRDYLTNNENVELADIFLIRIGTIYIQGALIATFTLGVFEIIKRKNKIQNLTKS